jgi:hypothetical protein
MSQHKQIIEVNEETFSLEYSEDNGWYKGAVYPYTKWVKAGSDETGWSYGSKTSPDSHDTLNNDCRVLFEFNFCWRGVWEGRVYFKDEEYWAEELSTMALLWAQVEALLKAQIRQARPGETLED